MPRAIFEALGGYDEIPFMEDVRIVQALRTRGRLVILPQAVHTSGRRWQRDGVLYTTVRNTILITLYFCGVPPATLQRWYTARRRGQSMRFLYPCHSFSRSSNFLILPVEVLGRSQNSTAFGHLKCAMCWRQKAIMSSAVGCIPALRTTKALGTSPQRSSGMATTATSCTAGCR